MLTAVAGFIIVGIIQCAFLLGLRSGIAALILIRPICDRIFELGRFEFAGSEISGGAFINLIVIIVTMLNAQSIVRSMPAGLRTTWLPFVLVTFAAVLYSPLPIGGFRKFLTYVSFAAVFLLAFLVVKTEQDLRHYLKLIVLSSAVPVLYGLFQAVTGIDWYLDARINSTFTHPNIFAFYLVTIIGAILYLLAANSASERGHIRVILLVYLLPILVLLILTKTRTAWGGCFMLFLAYGVIYDRLVLIAVLVSPFLALAVPEVSDRLMELGSRDEYIGGPGADVNSLAWRQLLWSSAMTYIAQRPFFGFGLDSFSFYSPEFFPLEQVAERTPTACMFNCFSRRGYLVCLAFSGYL